MVRILAFVAAAAAVLGAVAGAGWCFPVAGLALAGCVAIVARPARPALRWSLSAAIFLLLAGYAYTPAPAAFTPGLLLCGVALLFLPRVPGRGAAAGIVAGLALLVTLLEGLPDLDLLAPMLAETFPALSTVLAAAVVLHLAVARAGRSPWAAAGALLMFVVAALAWTSAASWWELRRRSEDAAGNVFLAAAVTDATVEWSAVSVAAILLTMAGPLLFCWGAIRAADRT